MHIHDADAAVIGTIPTVTFERLHEQFYRTKRSFPSTFNSLHADPFLIELVRLVQRYDISSTSRTNWSVHPPIYSVLFKILPHNGRIERFASPFNSHPSSDIYFSAHERDTLFGALHDALSPNHHWFAPSLINAPFTNQLLSTSLSAAIHAVSSCPHSFHFVTVPEWEHMPFYSLISSPFVHTLVSFDAGTIPFVPPHTLSNSNTVDNTTWGFRILLVANSTSAQHTLSQSSAHLESLQELVSTFNGNFFPFTQDTFPIPSNEVTSYPRFPIYSPDLTPVDRFDFSLPWKCDHNRTLLRQCVRSTEHTSSISAIDFHVNNFKKYKEIFSGLTISYLDHNAGSLCMACPMAHHDSMLSSFIDDPHYSPVELTQRDVLKIWRTAYNDLDLKRFVAWPSAASLAQPYIIPKQKDLNKMRPIVPYTKHPLRRLFNMASRAITYIFNNISAKSFTLSKTGDLPEVLSHVNNILKQNPDFVVSAQLGDVKNMYTELPHEDIIAALEWAFSLFKSQHNTTFVTVDRFGRNGVSTGVRKRKSSCVFSLEDLTAIVKFDLDNCYSVGGSIIQQTVGIPMGSPLSPALAVLICIFYEHSMISDLPPHPNVHLVGTRYIDDLAVFFVHHPSSADTLPALWENCRNAYHENMQLEVETHNNSFKFLGSDIFVNPTQGVSSKLHNANLPSLSTTATQQFYRFPHFHSSTSSQIKSSTLFTMLHRAYVYSSNTTSLIYSVVALLHEFTSLQYPRVLLKKTLHKASTIWPSAAWKVAANQFLPKPYT